MKIFAAVALLATAPAFATDAVPATTASATAVTAAPAAPKERMICRTSVDTGSLVRRTKRCATAETWNRRTTGENDAARELVRANTGLVNGN